jgi:hypothetical protein
MTPSGLRQEMYASYSAPLIITFALWFCVLFVRRENSTGMLGGTREALTACMNLTQTREGSGLG